jgi:iron complex transport system substrate-binding protein
MMPAAPRIISLLPSATEIVCALGGADGLIGISHECDFPPAIRDRAVLTRARIDVGGSSRAIDTAVREVVRSALSIYAVDEEKIAALEPDVVITQDLCEVCAVSLDDVRAAVARLAHRRDVEIVSLRPTRLDDVFSDIERVAAAIGRPAPGSSVRAELTERVRAIAARAAKAREKPRVVSLEWIDPLMIGGLWMPEIIEAAGGVAAGVAPGQPAPTLDADALRALAPDVVIVKPCGFPLDRALAEGEILARSVLRVVGDSARVYVTDGNAYFNRPGPRLVDSIEIAASCIHPALFVDFAAKHEHVITRLPH